MKMSRNLESTTRLTEFAPLSPEPEDAPGLSYLFSRFFKRNISGDSKQAPTPPVENKLPPEKLAATNHPNEAGTMRELNKELTSESTSLNGNNPDRYSLVIVKDGRSLPNVLKRISNLLALKNTGLQSYKDTDLKQYWMPDSVSKECYECSEKFTTFRRRHHCRVCGQIFCSRCCNQEIPGKIMGCTGDLRVCTYCGKVVLSYLQSADMNADLSADLRALQEDLQTKFGAQSCDFTPSLSANQTLIVPSAEHAEGVRRKPSVGYQEERFAQARVYSGNCLGAEERCRILQSSRSLRLLHEELADPTSGLVTQQTSLQKRSHQTCFSGSELVDWLLSHNKAVVREQGRALGQALLEAGYLESLTMEIKEFSDGYTLYRLRSSPPSPSPPAQQQQQQQQNNNSTSQLSQSSDQGPPPTPPPPTSAQSSAGDPDSEEIFWYSTQLAQHQDSAATDSESEMSLPSSASLFHLDLNLEESTVHISRPVPTTPSPRPSKRAKSNSKSENQRNSESVAENCIRDIVQLYRNSSKHTKRPVNWNKAATRFSQSGDDNGEKQAYETLTAAFKLHNQNLLKQLLNAEGLSQSWADVVIPVAQQVVDTIKPDLRSDENMDIRQYVQLKKVPGGSRSECCIVGGVVCTKNVAHRAMNAKLFNPRILLLRCAIVYQRVEGRFMSLEPVLMQEQEYLRHVVTRIAAMNPNLVLVQKNVSRLAQESLLSLGITLVLNVKPSVLERVARVTRADIVQSVDAHVGRPNLGTCRYFHIETFNTDTGGTKTLMFLEGCSVPHHGCTVLLRGGTLQEMAKLKRVVSRMVFSLYNWRLERSFLMDEFANPPRQSVLDDTFFEEPPPPAAGFVSASTKAGEDVDEPLKVKREPKTETIKEHSADKENIPISDAAGSANCSIGSNGRVRRVGVDLTRSDRETAVPSIIKANEINVVDKLSTLGGSGCKEKSGGDERRINVESISDFSDPLHLYMTLEDEVFNANENPSAGSQALSVAELPVINKFRKALDDTILCVSPYLKVPVPYLETETGRHCELRRYLPEVIFWSAQISDDKTAQRNSVAETSANMHIDSKLQGVKLGPKHPFVEAKLTTPADSTEVQNMLANFRACGGRLPLSSAMTVSASPAPQHSAYTLQTPPLLDALDPANHQKLAVLFCSYSHISNNAPAFCVNPWVVHMDFYGRNDIPLGDFLERYCFRTSYNCPSKTCDTPMVEHIRRFVHSGGAVHIGLQQLETAPSTDDDRVLMWSWCPISKLDSPVMVMSSDTWSFSFAKYLELRFHGDMYTPRGGTMESKCDHSLHHNHIQYFGYKNLVAYFKYTKIVVWEVSLPPCLLHTQAEPYQQAPVLEEMKRWALTGHEVFSNILAKLCSMAQNGDASNSVSALKQQLQKDQALFKLRVEEIQMKMTSPTLEGTGDTGNDLVKLSMWKLSDSLVLLKRLVAESVQDWNGRLSEYETNLSNARKREEKAKKNSTEQKTAATTAAVAGGGGGLADIIEGVMTSHFPDTQYMSADGMPIEEKTLLQSQPSQSSLYSEPEVAMETDEYRSTNEADDGTDEQPVFTISDGRVGELGADLLLATVKENNRHVATVTSGEEISKGASCQQAEDDSGAGPPTLETDRRSSDADNNLLETEEGDTSSTQIGSKHDKKSVKTILSQLLPTPQAAALIQCPMSAQEHHCLPLGVSVPIIVYEREPSSIIAYALSSHDYRIDLEELTNSKVPPPEQPSPSPVNKRKSGNSESARESSSETSAPPSEQRRSGAGVLSFLRAAASASASTTAAGPSSTTGGGQNVNRPTSGVSVCGNDAAQSHQGATAGDTVPSPSACEPEEPPADGQQKPKPAKTLSSLHLEVQFSDTSANFVVKVYFAEQFARLRASVFPAGEEAFVRSLSRCIQWAARGGKSGSNFCKTKDDRFILKEMSRVETQIFVESALNYFDYMESCVATNTPTLLGKIVGVYRVMYRSAPSTNTQMRSNLLVMENLFHARLVKNKFDLKGSIRNRLVNPNEQEGEIVLLDENLLNRTCDSPLYIQPHAKTVLMQAIHQDTQFLASQSVMDYSLLVGLDESKKELVVGIIDYIRTFTWDKRLETMVKRSGLLGGQGKQPTIVSPEEYRDRFIAAMHKYFLPVPDRWTGLGKGLDC